MRRIIISVLVIMLCIAGLVICFMGLIGRPLIIFNFANFTKTTSCPCTISLEDTLSINCNNIEYQHNKILNYKGTKPSSATQNYKLYTLNKDILKINIICNKKTYSYNDIYTTPTNHIMAHEFETRYINKPLSQKISKMVERYNETQSKVDAVDWVFPHIEKFVNHIVKSTNIAPVNSKIIFLPNDEEIFNVIRGKYGSVVDKYDVKESIYDAIVNRQQNITINPTEITPDITRKDNLKCTKLRASFSTDYSRSTYARKHNIQLALKNINGTVLKPNEMFSFNKVVGARTEETGYLESKIIMKGKFIEGIGGGVCQVSTTLYNAAIRADMAIVSVRAHSLPIAYVPPSFDAMVNSGSTDLRFQNTLSTPIFIRAYTNNGQIIIEFYGEKLPYTIVPESETVDTLPPPLTDEEIIDFEYKYIKPEMLMSSGEKIKVLDGRGGLISNGYLNYVDSTGQIIARKQIRSDKYQPQQGLIAIAP